MFQILQLITDKYVRNNSFLERKLLALCNAKKKTIGMIFLNANLLQNSFQWIYILRCSIEYYTLLHELKILIKEKGVLSLFIHIEKKITHGKHYMHTNYIHIL